MPSSRRAAATVLALAAGVLPTVTACGAGGITGSAPQGNATATATTAATLSARVSLDRSGGFAGIPQRIVVEPTGEWTVTGPARSSRTGTLSPDQLAVLRRLSEDPALWVESRRSPPPVACSDAYSYVVSIGDHTATADDCTLDARPALRSIVTLLTGVAGG